jgi:hypothetical protein
VKKIIKISNRVLKSMENGKMASRNPWLLRLPPKLEDARIEKVPAANSSKTIEREPNNMTCANKNLVFVELKTQRNRRLRVMGGLYAMN